MELRDLLKAGLFFAATTACIAGWSSGSWAADPVTLTLWLESRGAPDKISDALADFTAKTGIRVERSDVAHDSVSNGINRAVGTELFPDVIIQFTGIGLSGAFLDAKQVDALDKYYDLYGWVNNVQPGGVALGTFDGKKMSVPFTTYGMAAWYKKSAFEKAGIAAPPKTFDEFVADMDKLVAVGIAPLSFGGKGVWDPMRLVDFIFEHECGPETFDALRGLRADFTKTPCATAALKRYGEWVDKYMIKGWEGLEPESNQHYGPIFAGKAAMTFDPSWAGGNIEAAGQNTADYGVFALPSDTGRTYGFGENLWISSTSKHKDEAAKLIDFLVSKEVQEKYAGQLRTVIPANVHADFKNGLDDFSKAFVDVVQSGKGVYLPADQAFPKVLVDSWERNFQKVGAKLLTPEEAVAAIQADIDSYKAQH